MDIIKNLSSTPKKRKIYLERIINKEISVSDGNYIKAGKKLVGIYEKEKNYPAIVYVCNRIGMTKEAVEAYNKMQSKK